MIGSRSEDVDGEEEEKLHKKKNKKTNNEVTAIP